MSESIDRALWNVLRPQGDPLGRTVTVSASSVGIEADGGLASVDAYVQDDGVDIRVGDLQLCVKRGHVTLLQSHLPYPINRWTILWEGDIS